MRVMCILCLFASCMSIVVGCNNKLVRDNSLARHQILSESAMISIVMYCTGNMGLNGPSIFVGSG